MDFYAVGAFVHTLSAIGALGKGGRYVPSVGFEKAFEYCSQVGFRPILCVWCVFYLLLFISCTCCE